MRYFDADLCCVGQGLFEDGARQFIRSRLELSIVADPLKNGRHRSMKRLGCNKWKAHPMSVCRETERPTHPGDPPIHAFFCPVKWSRIPFFVL